MKQETTKNEKILFSQCCDEWLIQKENFIKISSYCNYKFAVEKHIKPILGDKTLLEIEQYDMNDFIKKEKTAIENMKDIEELEDLEDSDIKDIIIKLKSILRYTKKKYGIDFDFDVFTGISSNSNEVEVFNEKERQKLYRYLTTSNELRDLGVLISLYSGLRIGEVCGLKWKDIDLENKIIYVNRTVQRVYLGKNEKSKIIITPPKTKKSKRKVPISKVLVEKLKEFNDDYSKECYITTGLDDKSYEPLTYRYDYKQVLIKCGIPYKKFHVCRHTFATRCIRVGMDVKSLSEVLGHSNIGITMNLYVHSSYEVKKKYIDRL
ncbi:MAG: site-specific integrase [Clostridia bacterium]|nr:site-specific integrase [Clostridia bacterium]